MKLLKKLFHVGMLVACASLWVACSKDEACDVMGDASNRVYLIDYAVDYKIVITPVSAVSNLDIKIPVKCNKMATEIIKVTVEVDNSLIDEYNIKHGTSYEPFPAGALMFENQTMTIPAGAMITQDSVHITLTNDFNITSKMKSDNGYLLPLRVTKVEGGEAVPSTNLFSSYFTMTKENINHEATEADIKGMLVEDQTGWSATTDGVIAPYYAPIETLFDGDNSTFCYIGRASGKSSVTIEVDMRKNYTFDAIRMDANSWGSFSGALEVGTVISISTDGTAWKEVGKVTKGYGSSGAAFCAFYDSLIARYIRLVIPTYGSRLGRFNVHQTK